MTQSLFSSLKPKLAAAGFDYAFVEERLDPYVDPESLILEALPLFFEDRKAFRMLLTWVDQVSFLIHVERLLSLGSTVNDSRTKILLLVLAHREVRRGDRRWQLLLRRIKIDKREIAAFPIPESYSSDWLFQKGGEDPDFAAIGIKLPVISEEQGKKIQSLEVILERQKWLRVRALIGANFRADLIAVLLSKRAMNAYQASKVMGCSRETAYRLWRETSYFKRLELLVV